MKQIIIIVWGKRMCNFKIFTNGKYDKKLKNGLQLAQLVIRILSQIVNLDLKIILLNVFI